MEVSRRREGMGTFWCSRWACNGIGRKSTGRNVFSTIDATTKYSIPDKDCIIGVGFKGIALVIRKTGIQEFLQGPSQSCNDPDYLGCPFCLVTAKLGK